VSAVLFCVCVGGEGGARVSSESGPLLFCGFGCFGEALLYFAVRPCLVGHSRIQPNNPNSTLKPTTHNHIPAPCTAPS